MVAKTPKHWLSERAYYRLCAAGLLLLFPAAMTLISLPFAFESMHRLREAYDGSRSVQMIVFKTGRGQQCGVYQFGASGLRWKFIGEADGFWAEEKSEQWRRLGDLSQPGRDWNTCMNRPSRWGDMDFAAKAIVNA